MVLVERCAMASESTGAKRLQMEMQAQPGTGEAEMQGQVKHNERERDVMKGWRRESSIKRKGK